MAEFAFKYQLEIDALIDKGAQLPLLFNPKNKLCLSICFQYGKSE